MAESRGSTICELLGIQCHQDMSENELNWWLARATKKPFLGDQINLLGAYEGRRKHVDWWLKRMEDDSEAVKATERLQKNLDEKRRLENESTN